MSENDEVKELADKMGGWENLARGLHHLYTRGDKSLLDEFHNQTEKLRISREFFPVKRGAKKKRDWVWFMKVEDILSKAKNQHDKEEFIIDKNLDEICGKAVTGKRARDEANKTIRNELAKFRKEFKDASKEFDPKLDLGTTFLAGYEESPSGVEYIDDPRLYD